MTSLETALALLEIDQGLRRAKTPDQERDAHLFAAMLTMQSGNSVKDEIMGAFDRTIAMLVADDQKTLRRA